MTCNATLAGRGVIPCTNEQPHNPPQGCLFEGVDYADRTHHEHDEEDR